MSVIEIDGIAWAAGLDWLPRANAAQTAYEARRGKSEWYAHHGDQTGYARGSERYAAGMPVLAAALHEAIPEDRWMVLLIGDFGGCALVQVNDGVILSDGDRVFEKLEDGRRALDGLDKAGWAFYASAGVLEGAKSIDVKGLERVAGLKAVPLAGVTKRTAVGAAAGLSLAAAVVAIWVMRSDIIRWVFPPPDPIALPEKGKEPRIAAVIDSGAFIQGCREAMRRYTPGIPGWNVANLECTAKFAERALIAIRPALKDRPAMIVKWRMNGGEEESLHRSVVERHLSAWKRTRGGGGFEAQVDGARAWMVVELPPVAVEAAGSMPSRLAMRGLVDRRFGLRASKIEHSDKGGTIRIVMEEPLSEIRGLFEGLNGFELTRLARAGDGWVLEGRREKPVKIRESAFAAVRRFIE
ncbi:MAG: hypothetical protein OYH76_19930 [Defluviicoccus sp.]|nr:hypothetical protein [Defluviicoccus sp.]MDE0278172.1 hypothetical protein [Defluviicoccus sp.]